MSHARRAVTALLCFLGILPGGSIRETTSGGNVVVIIMDYDGCFDVVAMEKQLGHMIDRMDGPGSKTWFEKPEIQEKLQGIKKQDELVGKFDQFVDKITDGATQVIVFLGSSRQDTLYDTRLGKEHKNGFARNALKAWVELKVEEGKPWRLEKTLLADYDIIKDSAGNLERRGKKTIRPGFTAWDGQQKLSKTVNLNVDAHQKFLKTEIAKVATETLADVIETSDSVDIYFFDDQPAYLEYVRGNVPTPDKVTLYTVWWNWLAYATGEPDEGVPDDWTIDAELSPA